MDTAVDDRVTYIIITIIKSITVDVCVGFVFLTAHGQQGLVHLKYFGLILSCKKTKYADIFSPQNQK